MINSTIKQHIYLCIVGQEIIVAGHTRCLPVSALSVPATLQAGAGSQQVWVSCDEAAILGPGKQGTGISLPPATEGATIPSQAAAHLTPWR